MSDLSLRDSGFTGGFPANLGFSIPPNAVGYSSTFGGTSPVAVTIWGVLPHMHVKGRKIQVAVGNGCLVDIPAWDFRWQQAYFFQTPLPITTGTALALTCTWDNPTASAVTWGESTSDEMCLSYLYLTL